MTLRDHVLSLWGAGHNTLDIADDTGLIARVPRMDRTQRQALVCRIIHHEQDLRYAERKARVA